MFTHRRITRSTIARASLTAGVAVAAILGLTPTANAAYGVLQCTGGTYTTYYIGGYQQITSSSDSRLYRAKHNDLGGAYFYVTGYWQYSGGANEYYSNGASDRNVWAGRWNSPTPYGSLSNTVANRYDIADTFDLQKSC